MKKGCFLLIFLTAMVSNQSDIFALVLKGSDTLTTYADNAYLVGRAKVGYDFVNQVACTSYTNYSGCNNHFELQQRVNGTEGWAYGLQAPNSGYGVNMGFINLDSLKTAPADSIFNKYPSPFDQIPVSPDSLASRVGCSYWIKTGPDPQDGNSKLFAKIRILSIKVLDSANHKVSMRFIYATDVYGTKTAATSNFDTFFNTTAVLTPRRASSALRSSPATYRVFGDRFAVPREFQGIGGVAEVYSLAGRRLGAVAVGKHAREVDLRKVKTGAGVVVVRMRMSEP